MKQSEFIKNVRGLTPEKILAKITEDKKSLVELEQKKVLGSLKSSAEIRSLRRNIARLNTVLDEKLSHTAKENNA